MSATPGPARHVGFIRAVMQGREGLHRDVLLAAVAAAGGAGARTHRSTGNVSFSAPDGAAVCAALAERLTAFLDRPTPVLHRSLEDLRALVDRAPFAGAADGEHIVVLGARALAPALDRMDLPHGVVLLGHAGADAWFVRSESHGPHPMPLLEAAGADPVTARSIGTLEHVADRAG